MRNRPLTRRAAWMEVGAECLESEAEKVTRRLLRMSPPESETERKRDLRGRGNARERPGARERSCFLSVAVVTGSELTEQLTKIKKSACKN